VIERRDLSDLVTERLGVPHASPQGSSFDTAAACGTPLTMR
jgi:hypothetical protein